MVWSGLQLTLPAILSTLLNSMCQFHSLSDFPLLSQDAARNNRDHMAFFFTTVGKEQLGFSWPPNKSPELWADWATLEPISVARKISGCWLVYARVTYTNHLWDWGWVPPQRMWLLPAREGIEQRLEEAIPAECLLQSFFTHRVWITNWFLFTIRYKLCKEKSISSINLPSQIFKDGFTFSKT